LSATNRCFRRNSLLKDDPVIHQIHQFDAGVDDLLVAEDADDAEGVFALRLKGIKRGQI
jgi:hypothetical protein